MSNGNGNDKLETIGRGQAETPAILPRGGETGRDVREPGFDLGRGRGSETGRREIPVSPTEQFSCWKIRVRIIFSIIFF